MGLSLVGGDGVTLFITTNATTVGGAAVQFNAVTTGTAGNLSVGQKVQFVTPPAGVDAAVTVSGATTGGTAQEAAGPLLSRILFRWRNPPKGGTAPDYRSVAEAAGRAVPDDGLVGSAGTLVRPSESSFGRRLRSSPVTVMVRRP